MSQLEKTKLPLIVLCAMGGAVFAMHFGASCMLWPTTWGRDSGLSWLTAFSGFFISGVILPYLGYLAVANGGTLFELARRVGPKFAYLFGTLLVLVLGPLFVIPRMSAASWDALSRALRIDAHEASWVLSCLFTLAYYLIVYWFIYKENEIVDKLSKYLVPFLVLLEAFLIISTLVSPIGEAVPKHYSQSAFAYGFINGYQTMDLPASLMYAAIIITSIKAYGVHDFKPMIAILLKAAGLGFILFTLVMFGEFFRGHTASGVFVDVSYAKLSADIILHQWGRIGAAVFNGALVFAAMTTAIGVTAGTASFFNSASNEKISYKKACVGTLICSTIISVGGLSAIISWSVPILNLIYPPCIALVVFMAFFPKKINMMRGACYFTLGWGIIESLNGYLGLIGFPEALSGIFTLIPGARDGFGFIPFLILGTVFGALTLKKEEYVPATF